MSDGNESQDVNATSPETKSEGAPPASAPPASASDDAHASVADALVAAAESAPPPPPSASTDGEVEGAEAGEADEANETSEAGEASAPGEPGEPGKKKKRRRRKKGAGAQATEGGAPGEEGAPREHAQRNKKQAPRKDAGQIPFGRFFEGSTHASRRHAFSVGEIVAGRVSKVGDGAFQVDLFGKAIAVVDETEPREIPIPVQHELPPAAVEAAAPATAATVDASAADASAVDASAAEVSATGETTASGESAPEAHAAHDEHNVDDGGAHAESETHEEASEHEETAAGELAAPLEPAAPPPPLPNVGEIYRGRVGAVAESGHIAIINRIVDVKAARAYLEKARDEKKRVKGLVYGFNRGGFDVIVEGIRVFCPASGMSLTHIEQPDELVGLKLEFSVPPTKQGTHGVVISRRGILEREGRKAARERLKTMKVGEEVKGRVSQVREFGLFIDIGGGLEGMVHVSEMSWDRNARPMDVAKVGDELTARVIKLPENRKERHERIGLSLKVLQPDPWDVHGELLAEGRVFKGKVARVLEFGAFVEVAPGVEGLLHVSELGRDITHAGSVLKEGEELDLIIERTDKKQHRVSLSKLSAADLAAIAEGAASGAEVARPPRQGGQAKVKVDRVEHHGVFVQVVGVVGKRGRGYIPNSEMGTERGTDHRRMFPQGKELEVKCIGSERDGGLKFSRKGFLNDEEKRAVQDYRREASKQGFGTFGDLLRAKLGEK